MLGDADLVRRQHLQQEGLELVVGPVDLVDQQHRRAVAQRAQHRAVEQEALAVQGPLDLVGVRSRGRRRGGLDRAQVQDLAREVPVVQRLARVDALVALQPDQLDAQQLGQRLGERRLAGAGLALEQQRAAHRQREPAGRRQALVGQVARGGQLLRPARLGGRWR